MPNSASVYQMKGAPKCWQEAGGIKEPIKKELVNNVNNTGVKTFTKICL